MKVLFLLARVLCLPIFLLFTPLSAMGDVLPFLWSQSSSFTLLSSYGLSSANGINNYANIAGNDLNYNPVIYTPNNGLLTLNLLPGSIPGNPNNQAIYINNNNQAAGEVMKQLNNSYYSTYVFWNGQNSAVPIPQGIDGTPGSLGLRSYVYGMNDNGQVVGYGLKTSDPTGQQYAYVWDSINGMHEIAGMGGKNNGASSINNLGQVVGWTTDSNNVMHAYLWDNTSGMHDLGLGWATSINNSGQILIYDNHHYYIWTAAKGRIDTGIDTDMGVRGINNSGQIVGYENLGYNNQIQAYITHTYIWSEEGGLVDIGEPTIPGFTIQAVLGEGFNDNGQIVGGIWGNYNTVPLPPTVLLLGSGLLGLAGWRRFRKSQSEIRS